MKRVRKIVEMLKAAPDAEISRLRAEIDEQIFDLFEIHDSREKVLRFYESIGKVAKGGVETAQEASA